MKSVLNAAEVRQAEQDWAAEHGHATWPLMERAAKSFVQQFLPVFADQKIRIVVGAGNNGGDGYLIAKLLRDKNVDVTLAAPLGPPPESIDAFRAYQIYLNNGGQVVEVSHWNDADILIDALLGSGLSRDLTVDVQALVEQINQSGAKVFSVDIPTGLNAQTGEPMPVAINAQSTHSFIALKPGLLTGNGPSICGNVTLDSLGVTLKSQWHQTTEIVLPDRCGNTHKANHGQVLVIGGLQDMAGAAVIASQAALNAGSGRVLLHCNPEYFVSAISQAPELIMARDVPDAVLQRAVVLAGPGLGQSDSAEALMQQVLAVSQRGVLDADALRFLASQPQAVPAFVLTPHEGEAAALLDWDAEKVRTDRVRAVLALAEKYQTTAVLKGAGTLVASQGKLWFCHSGTPKMATPGMGDCLAGIVASLMAQGQNQTIAAINAVNWHASIACDVAEQQRLVLATDIIERLKKNRIRM